MSPLGASLTTLVVLWGAFLASPYVAVVRTADEIATGDIPALVERVNIHAVRASLVRQLVTSGIAEADRARIDPGSVGIGAGTVSATLGPAIADTVTPQRAAEFLAVERGARGTGRTGLSDRLGQIATLVWSSRWRGFRNVYVALPPRAAPDRQVRVQFRLSRFSWRIVALDLPRDARERLLRALVGSR